jgi:PKD repeat protein
MKKIYLLCILFIAILLCGKVSAQVIDHGVVGYETRSATVSLSDMQAYDAAHPELRTNRKVFHDAEYSHQEFMNSRGLGNHNNNNQNQNNQSGHHIKDVQVVSPAPTITFDGEDDNGTLIPPDVSGAVGPNHVLTAHNQDVKITNKSGVQISSVTLDAFWSSVLPGGGTFDPKEVYDPYSNRYIMVTLGGGGANTSCVLIGVSATNDPTGTWHLFNILVDNTGTNWLDFPELGFNKNWIAVGGNLFGISSGTANGAALFVFNKGNLYNNTNSQHTLFESSLTNDFCVTPVNTLDANENSLFCLESWNGGNAQIMLHKITGTPAVPVLTVGVATITGTIPWQVPSSTNFGTQLGSGIQIDCGDDRLTSGVYRNHRLWTSHNAYLPATGNPNRCSSEWWQVDTAGNIVQNSTIDDNTGAIFHFYPSVAVNANNDALIGYSTTGASIHPSSAYSYRAHTDAINTFESTYTYQPGMNIYTKDFGSGRYRWGDYSYAMVDPSNDQDFWTVTEYAEATADTWGTWWAKVATCVVPSQPPTIFGPTSFCSSNLTPTYYSIAPLAGATSYTWTVTGTGWTHIASTVDSVLVTPGSGTGTITVRGNDSCGSGIVQTITITIVNGAPAQPGAISGVTSVCAGDVQTYAVSLVTGATSYTWTLPNGWTCTSLTNSITVTVGSVSGNISVTADNGCGSSTASTLAVNLPTAPTATSPVNINCGATATLTASGNPTLNWFNVSTGGNSLGAGTTYVTPPLNASTTYYVESDPGSPFDHCPPFNENFGTGGYFTGSNAHADVFNVNVPCTLVSVDVDAQGAGNRTINLLNSALTVINSITVNVPNGLSTVTLNFPLSVGTGYELSCGDGVNGTNLYRNATGAAFPYNDVNGYISITGNDIPDNVHYYYFYNWKLQVPGCTSARTPVTVLINGITSAFTYTQNGNTFTFTNTSTGATTYLWHFGDGNSSNLTNPVHTYLTNGAYVVTLIATNAGCSDSTSQTILVSTTGINLVTSFTSLNVYPNPVNDNQLTINLNTPDAGKQWTIKLFDVLGQTVYSDNLTSVIGANQKDLNLSKLNNGIYFIELQNNGEKLIRRISKE